jgi:hypothetical protein
MGMTTATGGRIRWEIIQKAMSPFDSDRRKRRPMAPNSTAKQPAAAAIATAGGAPDPTATAASSTQPANSTTTPTRGR